MIKSRLKIILAELNLSAKKLAEDSGLDEVYLSKLTQNKHKAFSIRKLNMLFKELKKYKPSLEFGDLFYYSDIQDTEKKTLVSLKAS